jgi:MFS superfamily sulfate permease-like transporter
MELLLILGILVAICVACAALCVSGIRQSARDESRSVSPLVPPDAGGDPESTTRPDADRAERVDGGYHFIHFL